GNRRLAECQARQAARSLLFGGRLRQYAEATDSRWHLLLAVRLKGPAHQIFALFEQSSICCLSQYELDFDDSPQHPFGSPVGKLSGEGIPLRASSTLGVAAAVSACFPPFVGALHGVGAVPLSSATTYFPQKPQPPLAARAARRPHGAVLVAAQRFSA